MKLDQYMHPEIPKILMYLIKETCIRQASAFSECALTWCISQVKCKTNFLGKKLNQSYYAILTPLKAPSTVGKVQ